MLDGAASEVYGVADFGAGPIQTPRFSVSGLAITSLDKVFIFQDYQFQLNRLGAEFDNISITAVPEPAEAALLVAGLALLSWRMRRGLGVR